MILTEENIVSTSERQWLAAYVKMHHERKVRDALTAMQIENFLPVQEEIRIWSDRKKKVERVLIPMMIFVKVNPQEQRTVVELSSVLRYMVLRGEHAPTPIPDYQMDSFRFMVTNAEDSITFDKELFQPGQKVRVIKGSLKNLEGELITTNDKTKIAVRIEQLGCATVEMHSSMVEIVG